jgi:hypothetical protein
MMPSVRSPLRGFWTLVIPILGAAVLGLLAPRWFAGQPPWPMVRPGGLPPGLVVPDPEVGWRAAALTEDSLTGVVTDARGRMTWPGAAPPIVVLGDELVVGQEVPRGERLGAWLSRLTGRRVEVLAAPGWTPDQALDAAGPPASGVITFAVVDPMNDAVEFAAGRTRALVRDGHLVGMAWPRGSLPRLGDDALATCVDGGLGGPAWLWLSTPPREIEAAEQALLARLRAAPGVRVAVSSSRTDADEPGFYRALRASQHPARMDSGQPFTRGAPSRRFLDGLPGAVPLLPEPEANGAWLADAPAWSARGHRLAALRLARTTGLPLLEDAVAALSTGDAPPPIRVDPSRVRQHSTWQWGAPLPTSFP